MAVRHRAPRWRIVVVLVVAVAAVLFCGYIAACEVLRPYALACDPHKPAGLTAADLAGAYQADDGSRLALKSDGTLTAAGFRSGRSLDDPLSGSGTWTLLSDGAADDLYLSIGTFGMYLEIGGTRKEPWLYWSGEDTGFCQQKRLSRV